MMTSRIWKETKEKKFKKNFFLNKNKRIRNIRFLENSDYFHLHALILKEKYLKMKLEKTV